MKPTKTPIDLLIFDLDGTLVDSKEDIADALNLTLKSMGLDEVPLATVAEYVGVSVKPLIQSLLSQDPKWAAKLEEVWQNFFSQYEKRLTHKTRPYPGISESLAYYSTKAKVVLTNKSNRFARPLLQGIALDNFFVEIFGAESFSKRKPDPLPILKICEQFNISPKKTVMIGDTENDIKAGKGAGCWTCAVKFGYGSHAILEELKPDFAVTEAAELMTLFS